ncbi:MAG TPA: hypothetical protein VFS21_19525 [Roseiflexaceae bacterium]|nr:hypothetical protein [Roseiflexaceae bacterium]
MSVIGTFLAAAGYSCFHARRARWKRAAGGIISDCEERNYVERRGDRASKRDQKRAIAALRQLNPFATDER